MNLTIIQWITNLTSLVTICIFFKHIFMKTEEEISKKWLVVGLVISDTIVSLAYVMIIGDAEQYDNDTNLSWCKLQGFMIHFGLLSSFAWINIIVLVLYNGLTRKLDISVPRTMTLCFGAPFAYCIFFWYFGVFGLKRAHSDYCGIKDNNLARLFLKIIPWALTTIIQIYYMLEIYRLLKRRAVTIDEWRQVGKMMLFPVTIILIYIFGIMNFVIEVFEPNHPTLKVFCIVLKNLFGGLQGFINVMIYGFDDYSTKLATYLFCIYNIDQNPTLEPAVQEYKKTPSKDDFE